jgi:hypothetical protein
MLKQHLHFGLFCKNSTFALLPSYSPYALVVAGASLLSLLVALAGSW